MSNMADLRELDRCLERLTERTEALGSGDGIFTNHDLATSKFAWEVTYAIALIAKEIAAIRTASTIPTYSEDAGQ